jgi:catabolite regulation protein CreA
MKKIKILFILMVTVLAVSCSSSGSKTIFFDLSETDQQLFREEISAVLDSVCLGRFYDTHKISHYDHIYVFALKDSYANAKIDSVLVHYIYTSINDGTWFSFRNVEKT